MAIVVAYITTNSGPISGIIGIVFGATFHFATSVFRIEFPRKFYFVKDLVRIVSTLDEAVWNKNEVYSRVKKLVVDQLGVKENNVHPNSHFIDDLGMG